MPEGETYREKVGAVIEKQGLQERCRMPVSYESSFSVKRIQEIYLKIESASCIIFMVLGYQGKNSYPVFVR